jgi:hypothetical protein
MAMKPRAMKSGGKKKKMMRGGDVSPDMVSPRKAMGMGMMGGGMVGEKKMKRGGAVGMKRGGAVGMKNKK